MGRSKRCIDVKKPHHIISRGIEERLLFSTDEDKELYLYLMETSAKVNGIEVLSYCLMDTHVHILVHPRGGNISKFMQNLNNPYAKKYNIKYSRKGHLFESRFQSYVVKDPSYLLRISTYIHDNPKSLLYKGYDSIVDYPYSSIKEYIDPKGGRGLAKPGYIFSQIGGGWVNAMNAYIELIEIQTRKREEFRRIEDEEFELEMQKALKEGRYLSDKSVHIHDADPKYIIKKLCSLYDVGSLTVSLCKYSRVNCEFRCMLALSLRMYCGMTLKEMTKIYKGLTVSAIGRLAQKGYQIYNSENEIVEVLEASLICR